jgi:hypothetical protein
VHDVGKYCPPGIGLDNQIMSDSLCAQGRLATEEIMRRRGCPAIRHQLDSP